MWVAGGGGWLLWAGVLRGTTRTRPPTSCTSNPMGGSRPGSSATSATTGWPTASTPHRSGAQSPQHNRPPFSQCKKSEGPHTCLGLSWGCHKQIEPVCPTSHGHTLWTGHNDVKTQMPGSPDDKCTPSLVEKVENLHERSAQLYKKCGKSTKDHE